jgi:hypothetical protein
MPIKGINDAFYRDDEVFHVHGCHIVGDRNIVHGNGNTMIGDDCVAHGDRNVIKGKNPKGFGKKNTIVKVDEKRGRQPVRTSEKMDKQDRKRFKAGASFFSNALNTASSVLFPFLDSGKSESTSISTDLPQRLDYDSYSDPPQTLPEYWPDLNDHKRPDSKKQGHQEGFIAVPEPEKNKEEESIREGQECVVCMARAKNTVIIDCGHSCMCVSCSIDVAGGKEVGKVKCPICQVEVTRILRVYS